MRKANRCRCSAALQPPHRQAHGLPRGHDAGLPCTTSTSARVKGKTQAVIGYLGRTRASGESCAAPPPPWRRPRNRSGHGCAENLFAASRMSSFPSVRRLWEVVLGERRGPRRRALHAACRRASSAALLEATAPTAKVFAIGRAERWCSSAVRRHRVCWGVLLRWFSSAAERLIAQLSNKKIAPCGDWAPRCRSHPRASLCARRAYDAPAPGRYTATRRSRSQSVANSWRCELFHAYRARNDLVARAHG